MADLRARELERQASQGNPEAQERLERHKHQVLIPAAFERWKEGLLEIIVAWRLDQLNRRGRVGKEMDLQDRDRPRLVVKESPRYWRVWVVKPWRLSENVELSGGPHAAVDRFTGNVLAYVPKGGWNKKRRYRKRQSEPGESVRGNVLDPHNGLKYCRPLCLTPYRETKPEDRASWPEQPARRPWWATKPSQRRGVRSSLQKEDADA